MTGNRTLAHASGGGVTPRILRAVARPRAPSFIAGLGCVLSLSFAASGFVADDYPLAEAVRRAPFGGFEFWSREPALRRATLLALRQRGLVFGAALATIPLAATRTGWSCSSALAAADGSR